MKIGITEDERFEYSITIDGETLLECLSKQEVEELTIGLIMELAADAE